MMSAESLFLGNSLLINCTTDLAVTSIELLDSSGDVLASGNGTHINLEIVEVTEAHNNQKCTCKNLWSIWQSNRHCIPKGANSKQ